MTASPAELIATLYDNPAECARIAKLRYVSPDQPGMTRLRSGRGFTYRDDQGVTIVDVKVRNRLQKIDVVDGYTSGALEGFVEGHRVQAGGWLNRNERLLLAFLSELLEQRAGELAG